ncbi:MULTISPECIES: acetyl-CoA carboxylase family protein [Prauserella salsuginis group]|uniref:acetyl-CoA carboxylase family protein n=1 Tax=Prauserella salsuginis group TaxID=2893672 RepID=UPI0021646DD6|nr:MULTISPECIES: carboxyl transferase domain-containing protein [Prauserella salsuginis group]
MSQSPLRSEREPVSRPGVLIANRGEIAVRIHRAARGLGYRTVAVHTPDDREGRVVSLADAAVALPDESGYLDAELLVRAAVEQGCTLLHPGYGFLSESAELARLCDKAGVTFVGPSPETLALLGDKARARELAVSLQVPVLPATPAGGDPAEAAELLQRLGDDGAVMVKAVGGGGGRGMRIVRRADELDDAWQRCRSEAERGFGTGELYAEQYLSRARHVEVQIIGDSEGGIAHLHDRDCSLQRRHQKVIEMAPSVTLAAAHREPLLAAATRIGAEVGYAGLATVEFLVDADHPERFYFLEVNPRVQVEHTVTEQVLGLDLVSAQLRVAAGASLAELGLTQDRIPAPRGLAVQLRVSTERLRPDGTSVSGTGRIETLQFPGGPGVRVDSHGTAGMAVTGRYDSLLAKIVSHTPSTDLAAGAAAAREALAETVVDGVPTNLDVLDRLLAHPAFAAGEITTGFFDEHASEFAPAEEEFAMPAGCGSVLAEFPGTVVDVPVAPGDHVLAGAPVVVLEAMKMEYVVAAPLAGVVEAVLVGTGDVAADGTELVRLQPDEEQSGARADEVAIDPDHIRPDLAEVIDRHRLGLDEARPEAVAKRRRSGHRTARENIADLVDADSFVEYGALAVAAQSRRRSQEDLITNTPADGMVTGVARVNGGRAAVLSYDYTVLAGTQGMRNHRKTDRLLELAEQQRLPVVLFAEGGGGRPGDTDHGGAAGLDVPTFATMGRLNGVVPTIGIATGRCFAGNAALLGCCDVIIATRDATIGMGGPAMIEGGGLGVYRPEEVGPAEVQAPNGVIDVLVENEAEAVEVARRYLSYFQGPATDWEAADQRMLRHVIGENRVRVYDVRRVIDLVADTDSVLELRRDFGTGIITALVRVEGRPMGLIANNPAYLGGAIDTPAADKAARFLQLCEAHGLPVLSLCDTPGFMVGPDVEKTATVRHFSRLFVIGAKLTVPLVTVLLRKAYGLGAQSMAGGSFKVPVATLSWPTGELGGMGLEGAVRLGYRRELEAIEDPAERQQRYEELVAEQYRHGKAINAAMVFEIDDVIDPAETRARVLAAMPAETIPSRRDFVDTW